MSQQTIPVIDVSPLLQGKQIIVVDDPGVKECVQSIHDACKHIGFFYIKCHGVDLSLISALEQEAEVFFKQSHGEKMKIAMKKSGLHWKGFFPVGDELTSGKPDNKEGIYFGEEYAVDSAPVRRGWAMHGPNQFPEPAGRWRALVLEYLDQLTKLGLKLMAGIALSLGLAADFFETRFCNPRPFTPFRIFRYPKGSGNMGVGRHTDYGVLTILKQDQVGGLEVELRDGSWLPAPPIEGTFVVNIGDMLQLWTKNYFVATPHRIRASLGRDRMSMPFFFDPAFNTSIAPMKVTSEFLAENNDHLTLRNAAGEVEFRANEADLKSVRYGDYITHKVSKVFPDLFKESHIVDNLNKMSQSKL